MSQLIFTADPLTTATAGAYEYDGKVPYMTAQASQRGLLPSAQYFRLNTDLAGTNTATTQNVFGVGVTLSTSTTYAFEYTVVFTKSAGTTSHSFGIGFGGTATLNNILYGGPFNNSGSAFTSGVASTPSTIASSTTSNINLFSGGTSAGRYVEVYIKGTLAVNLGGTFIPQYTLSAAPGGAYSTLTGSYFLIYPIGSSSGNINVGTWA